MMKEENTTQRIISTGRSLCAAMIFAAPLLAGCSVANLTEIRSITPSGSPFATALTEEYRRFAIFEADEMYDWIDSEHFASKGIRVSRGIVEQPEPLSAWGIPEEKIAEMTGVRERLVTFLDAGAREKLPEHAAKAQASFDCWVEQQEENWQLGHIAACRNGLYAALDNIETAITPHATILFEFDQSNVNQVGKIIIQRLAHDLEQLGPAEIIVDGHADRAGPDPYNLKLSRARSLAVWRELLVAGIDSRHIAIKASGEQMPAINTLDGEREPRNRRAEVTVSLNPMTVKPAAHDVADIHQ